MEKNNIESKIKKGLEEHKKFVTEMDQIWCENEAIYQGKFYKKYSQNLRSMIDLTREKDYAVRTSANHTFTFIRALHSMLVSNQPSVSVFPASSEETDKDASIAADNIAKYERNRTYLDDYVSKLVLQTLQYGNGIMKVYWNAKDGEPLDTNDDGTLLYSGNVSFQNVKVRHFIFDKSVDSFREASWCMEKIVLPIEDAKARYSNFAEEIKESSEINRYNVQKLENDSLDGMAVLWEYWEPKCYRNNNQGVYAVSTEDGKILEQREHPYSHGKLPYIFFTDIDIPGEAWGKSVIEMLKDPQKTLNRIMSQIIENVNTHGLIRIAKFENSPIRDDAINTDPIKIINVGGQGQPPVQLQPASLPAHVFKAYDMIVNVMEHIAGLRSYSRGEMTKTLSGFAAQLMIEQDQKVHIQLHNKYKRAIEELYRMDLSLCKQFWDESRSITVLGDERKYEFYKYNKINLDGKYDVRVDYGTSLPNDPASRRQAILELYRDGLLQDKNAVLRMLELGDISGIFDIAKDARKRQKEEIEIMKANGVEFGVREFESHKDHLDELYKYFQSSEFELLDEGIKQLLETHALEHEEAVKKEQSMNAAPQAGTTPAAPLMPK